MVLSPPSPPTNFHRENNFLNWGTLCFHPLDFPPKLTAKLVSALWTDSTYFAPLLGCFLFSSVLTLLNNDLEPVRDPALPNFFRKILPDLLRSSEISCNVAP